MLTHVPFDQAVGKTIQSLHQDSLWKDTLFIVFTDGTYSNVVAGADFEDHVLEFGDPIDLTQDIFGGETWVKAGIVTKEEIAQAEQAKRDTQAASRLRDERHQYESLKKKFES